MQGVDTRSLGELARLVGGELAGDPAIPIRGLASLERAAPGDLSFVTGPKHLGAAERSGASAFLAPPGLELPGRAVVRVGHPLAAVARLLRVFHPEPVPPAGVHPTAVVAESALIAAGAAVMAYVVVGADSVVAAGAVLHPHVVVGSRCRVGEGSVLHTHVVLREDVEVGRRVVVHAGTVLGADGFGYLFDGAHHQKIPHVGRVVVEDDVEIGANVTIDRAMLGETVIGRGTKIDNLVQIGHNTVVGADTIIVAQTGISGSCRVGSRVTLAGQVGVADHVTIGDGAQIGAQSGVHRDVPPGATLLGAPAIPAAEARRSMAAFPRLPEALRAVRQLSRRIDDLDRRLAQEGR
jgi:UDP-3-O-[3-hydroxymyristoyl] glucosamine N-acyltransferase